MRCLHIQRERVCATQARTPSTLVHSFLVCQLGARAVGIEDDFPFPPASRRCGRTSCETPAVANIGWPVRATPARRPAGGRRTQRDGVRPSTAQPNQDDASANVSAHPRVSSRLSLHSTCGHRLMAQRLCLCAHVYADTHTPIHRRSSSERARVGSTTRRIINFHYRSRTRLSQ